jgi:hypothetical protein
MDFQQAKESARSHRGTPVRQVGPITWVFDEDRQSDRVGWPGVIGGEFRTHFAGGRATVGPFVSLEVEYGSAGLSCAFPLFTKIEYRHRQLQASLRAPPFCLVDYKRDYVSLRNIVHPEGNGLRDRHSLKVQAGIPPHRFIDSHTEWGPEGLNIANIWQFERNHKRSTGQALWERIKDTVSGGVGRFPRHVFSY